MSFSTELYTQWNTDTVYEFDDNCILIPFGIKTVEYKNARINFNVLCVLTNDKSKNEHELIVYKFIKLYSFVFCDSTPLFDLFNEKLNIGVEIDYNKALLKQTKSLNNSINFSDVSFGLYFPENPLLDISYRSLYLKTNDKECDYFVWFLDNFSDSNWNIQYSTEKIFHREYQKIVKLCTLLEVVIGHSENCTNASICPLCNKPFIHRRMSEKAWLRQSLDNIINSSDTVESYIPLINIMREIRNKTSHDINFSKAGYINRDPGITTILQEYAIKNFENDESALSYIMINGYLVVKYLLLYKLYSIRYFPKLSNLNIYSTSA